jgi:hypothetical protein
MIGIHDPLLVPAGKAFKLTYTTGDARIPTSREAAKAARAFGSLVTRRTWSGQTWLVIDSSLREQAIAAYEASRV